MRKSRPTSRSTSRTDVWVDPVYKVGFLAIVCPPDRVLASLRAHTDAATAKTLLDAFGSLNDDVQGRATYYCSAAVPPTIIIWVRPPADPGTIAHESFHATSFVMARVGITLCDQSDEAFAYYLGSIVSRVSALAKG